MATESETKGRRRLRNVLALLLVIAAVAVAVLLLRACAPNPALLEQRAAERAAWEKAQTTEQRARAKAWDAAVSEMQRQRWLMATVFLIGNIIIAAAVFRSTRANAREMAASRRRLREALVRVAGRGTAGLGLACAVLIVIPIIEFLIVGGNGMYSGEQALAAIVTLATFLIVWVLSLGVASAVLWRRSRTG